MTPPTPEPPTRPALAFVGELDLPRTDGRVVAATLKAGESAEYSLGKDRRGYLVPATGAVEIDGVRVNARDGAAIADQDVLRVTALEDSELVLVDVA